MKIVVVDGYALNPGDLSWEPLKQMGDLILYDRTPLDLIVERCKGAAVVLTNKVPFSKTILEQIPGLKCICVTATGYNVIDTIAAKELGISVCNVPGYGTFSVAQHVFALLLEITNHVGRNARFVAEGNWPNAADWCYSDAPVMELADKTFGVVGFGNIGQRAAYIAKSFGMNVIFCNPSAKNSDIAEQVSLETLFKESDVISLHCPVTYNNKEFVNDALLRTMKPTAYLINTARGQLINEQELTNALNEGIIAGVGLDVLSQEPPPATNPLLHAKNCLITPHNAWISKEARIRVMDITTANVSGYLNGAEINCVN
jgi:glycerate dehydrogenase